MALPQAYAPQDGQRFQILCRNPAHGRAWEHCDYAVDRAERTYLLGEYHLAYGAGWEFRTIMLPLRFWPKKASA